MPLPNLIHPVPVEIEPIDRTATHVDPDYREETQTVAYGARTVVPGQILWSADNRLQPTRAGSEDESDGYVLFRRVDLNAAGLVDSPKQGDRFVAYGSGIGRREIDVYVVRVRPIGHYPDQFGYSMIKAFFRDRSPGRQRRGGS